MGLLCNNVVIGDFTPCIIPYSEHSIGTILIMGVVLVLLHVVSLFSCFGFGFLLSFTATHSCNVTFLLAVSALCFDKLACWSKMCSTTSITGQSSLVRRGLTFVSSQGFVDLVAM